MLWLVMGVVARLPFPLKGNDESTQVITSEHMVINICQLALGKVIPLKKRSVFRSNLVRGYQILAK